MTRRNLVMQSAMECFVVREGDWKLCLCPGSGAKGHHGNKPASEDAWRRALEQLAGAPKHTDLTGPPFVQLFNVATDPHEDHNLAPQQAERVARMVALLQKQIDAGRSTPGPALENDRAVKLHQRLPDFVRKVVK